MALTVALRDATPYRLRYLCTQDGAVTSPTNPDVDGLFVIPNDAGATPDLQTDILIASSVPGVNGLPLQSIILARVNGHGQFGPGALNQAQARALFLSDGGAAVAGPVLVTRAVCLFTPRTGRDVTWLVDANVDGQGDPVLEVRSTVGTAGTAYLDVWLRHTVDL